MGLNLVWQNKQYKKNKNNANRYSSIRIIFVPLSCAFFLSGIQKVRLLSKLIHKEFYLRQRFNQT